MYNGVGGMDQRVLGVFWVAAPGETGFAGMGVKDWGRDCVEVAAGLGEVEDGGGCEEGGDREDDFGWYGGEDADARIGGD